MYLVIFKSKPYDTIDAPPESIKETDVHLRLANPARRIASGDQCLPRPGEILPIPDAHVPDAGAFGEVEFLRALVEYIGPCDAGDGVGEALDLHRGFDHHDVGLEGFTALGGDRAEGEARFLACDVAAGFPPTQVQRVQVQLRQRT